VLAVGRRCAHRDLSRIFDFPEYYGRNWDAFNDCLGEYGWPAEASGVVMVFTGFDAFVARFADAAHVLLDICALRQRDALIAGNHLICLVQSDDPRLALAPVGATVPLWNRAEWFDRARLAGRLVGRLAAGSLGADALRLVAS
jgi:RNAse (barnase) inhibitor barstar